MSKFLDKIKNMPEEKRNIISLVTAAIITLLIILIWLISLSISWKNQEVVKKDSIFGSSTVSNFVKSISDKVNY